MVLKMLKGLGRLMLTTSVLSVIGLFLCVSEVKADPSITSVSYNSTSKELEITVNNDHATDDVSLGNLTVHINGDYSDTFDNSSNVGHGVSEVIRIPRKWFLSKGLYKDNNDGTASITVDKISASGQYSGGAALPSPLEATSLSVNVGTLYEVSASRPTNNDSTAARPSFKVHIQGSDGYDSLFNDKAFGFSDYTYEVYSDNASGYDKSNYIELIYKTSDSTRAAKEWYESEYVPAGTKYPSAPETIGSSKVVLEAKYFPVINDITIDSEIRLNGSIHSGTTFTGLNWDNSHVTIGLTEKFEPASGEALDKQVLNTSDIYATYMLKSAAEKYYSNMDVQSTQDKATITIGNSLISYGGGLVDKTKDGTITLAYGDVRYAYPINSTAVVPNTVLSSSLKGKFSPFYKTSDVLTFKAQESSSHTFTASEVSLTPGGNGTSIITFANASDESRASGLSMDWNEPNGIVETNGIVFDRTNKTFKVQAQSTATVGSTTSVSVTLSDASGTITGTIPVKVVNSVSDPTGFTTQFSEVVFFPGDSYEDVEITGIVPTTFPASLLYDYNSISAKTQSGSAIVKDVQYVAGVSGVSNPALRIVPTGTLGTTTLTVTLKHKTSGKTIQGQIRVTTTEASTVSAKDTADAVNNSGKNFITVGYELDVAQLILDNIKPSATGFTKSDITNIKVDGSSLSNGMWKPTTSEQNLTVTCTIAGTDITAANGMKVRSHCMPQVTYKSASSTGADHSILYFEAFPTRTATSYSDSKRINEVDSSRAELYIEDLSGKTLASRVVEVSGGNTISGDVLESLVSTAVNSNSSVFSGKDVTVAFRVVPISKTSTAADKSKVYGTSQATIYVVTSSDSSKDFNNSYAYGIDGQKVYLQPSPKSGVTFEKWNEDGNTDNPRPVTIKSSDRKSFTPVAKSKSSTTTTSSSSTAANASANKAGTASGGSGGAAGTGLDEVPKTAESNSAIWLIIFMVFAVMGTAYALYLQLKAATSKNDK